MNDQTIEAEIQARGLTAPRVKPEDITANIVHTEFVKHVSKGGQVLRWAILTTQSGFAVVGRPSVSVSSENDDEQIGRQVAYDNSRNELWPLMGYELKCRLHADQQPAPTVVLASSVAEVKATLDNTPEGFNARFVATQDGRFTDVTVPAVSGWPPREIDELKGGAE